MEKVHCMSSSSIHIHYNHDPVQALLCTQRAWERLAITYMYCSEVVELPLVAEKLRSEVCDVTC